MNLQKLFETQRVLDEHIYEKHPELRGQNNLDWKILALQVELGECANEWRGFKKWSNDQEARTVECCDWCSGKGKRYSFFVEGEANCNYCKGKGSVGNPLLEEYADVLHFALAIGLELGFTIESVYLLEKGSKTITERFNSLITGYGILAMQTHNTENSYRDLFAGTIRLGIKLGFTLEQIESAYYAKNKINHERQAVGY